MPTHSVIDPVSMVESIVGPRVAMPGFLTDSAKSDWHTSDLTMISVRTKREVVVRFKNLVSRRKKRAATIKLLAALATGCALGYLIGLLMLNPSSSANTAPAWEIDQLYANQVGIRIGDVRTRLSPGQTMPDGDLLVSVDLEQSIYTTNKKAVKLLAQK